MKVWVLCSVSILAAVVWTFAAAAQSDQPWLIDGKPIPLACFNTLRTYDSSRNTPVDLTKCQTGTPSGTIANGPTGFKDTDDSGYFHYTYLGEKDGLAVLFVDSSGGGTGHFSELWGLKRASNIVQLAQTYAAGDRCNGSVSNARLVGGNLRYDISITPFDLIDMGDKGSRLVAYQDLEAAALSCVAVVHMRNDKLEGVTLTEKALEDTPGWTGQYRYQSCFNRFYRDAVTRKETEMDAGRLSVFAHGFVQTCVKK